MPVVISIARCLLLNVEATATPKLTSLATIVHFLDGRHAIDPPKAEISVIWLQSAKLTCRCCKAVRDAIDPPKAEKSDNLLHPAKLTCRCCSVVRGAIDVPQKLKHPIFDYTMIIV